MLAERWSAVIERLQANGYHATAPQFGGLLAAGPRPRPWRTSTSGTVSG
jgi:hypothetical protein